MTDVAAGMGLAQMERYYKILSRRKDIINKYDPAFKSLGIEVLNHYTDDYSSSGHLYITRIPGIGVNAVSYTHLYKTSNFAAGCSREVIERGADMLGWSLDELIEKTILAMRSCESVYENI